MTFYYAARPSRTQQKSARRIRATDRAGVAKKDSRHTYPMFENV
jgi:hypothetical protein